MNSEMRDVILGAVAGMRGEVKSAEANEEAYAEGFCKAAELIGVSTRSLVRRAAMGAGLSKQAQAVSDQQLPLQVADNFPSRGGTRAFGNHYLENMGRLATLGEGTALGAALGSQRANRWLGRLKLRGFKGKGVGAVAGLTTGMLANLAGRGKAMVTRGRTAQDQIDHDRALDFRSLLVPGAGAFNGAKRQERVQLSRWHV